MDAKSYLTKLNRRTVQEEFLVLDLDTGMVDSYVGFTNGSGQYYVLNNRGPRVGDGGPERVCHVNVGLDLGGNPIALYVFQDQLKKDPGLWEFSAEFGQIRFYQNGNKT